MFVQHIHFSHTGPEVGDQNVTFTDRLQMFNDKKVKKTFTYPPCPREAGWVIVGAALDDRIGMMADQHWSWKV